MHFLENKEYYSDLAFRALSARFSNRAAFDVYSKAIASDVQKDAFLRVATYYLFLVKSGNWVVDDPASDAIVDYFTNSYKLIALISLIESLGDGEFIEFYESLVARPGAAEFPLTRVALDERYQQYKSRFGSFRRCIRFFERLDARDKRRLSEAFTNAQETISTKEIVRFLYEIRSKFVHEGRLILHLSDGPVVLFRDNKEPVLVHLSMALLGDIFECGVVAWFRPN